MKITVNGKTTQIKKVKNLHNCTLESISLQRNKYISGESHMLFKSQQLHQL